MGECEGAYLLANATEYHVQYPQRFTMSARREEVGTAKQNATSNTHNDSPCLRDEKRWESAKQNATSSTHNDSPCLRDEEPICRIQLCQSNTHNDSPCLRDERRWESAKERSTACAVVPDPCCFQRAPFLQETLSRQRWTYSHSPTRSAGWQPATLKLLHARGPRPTAPPSNGCAIRQSQSDTDE